jgi:hypothetical protein
MAERSLAANPHADSKARVPAGRAASRLAAAAVHTKEAQKLVDGATALRAVHDTVDLIQHHTVGSPVSHHLPPPKRVVRRSLNYCSRVDPIYRS